MIQSPPTSRCLCGQDVWQETFHYTKPPAKETAYEFLKRRGYDRTVWQCRACGHLQSFHEMDMTALYTGDYVNSTYGEDGVKRSFDKINSLPPERSDNIGRVKRIRTFADHHFANRKAASAPTILDVGSGLCVFLYRMKEAGWTCTALDPDPRAARHAQINAGVSAITGDFLKSDIPGRYDAITFNKVLEHVQEPHSLLQKAADYLNEDGFVYVELPDGEVAARYGLDREEFTIDHWHIFSAASLACLARQSGFVVQELERLHEPSDKYTLRAFLTK